MTTHARALSDWRYPSTKRGRSVRRHYLDTHGHPVASANADLPWSVSKVAAFAALPSRTVSSLDIERGRNVGTKRERGLDYLPSDIRAWLRGARVPPAEVDTGSRDIDLGRPLVTPEGAARFLNLNVSTMKSWRARGRGPVYYRLTARTVRYAPEELEAWADNNAER